MTYLTPRQAQLLAILQNRVEYSLLDLIDAMGMRHNGKDSTGLRYNLERLTERELITAIGDIKVRGCKFEITEYGLSALRAHQRESYVAPKVTPSPKIDKFAGVYVPAKAYYRNDGHVGIRSRGIGA